MSPPGPLHGVRVIELASIAGAYCGKLLADMGADVLLLEPPEGSALHRLGPFYRGRPHPDHSLPFWHYNTNKRSIVIDLESAAGRARLGALGRDADIVIAARSIEPPSAHLRTAADVHAINPRITFVAITPFGASGPHRDYRASDLVAQALGGMVFVNGDADAPPLQGFGLQAYHSASTYAAIGALLALIARRRIGGGQCVDVSIQECVAASLEHASSYFHQNGTIAERNGSLHWTRYFRVGRCRDGYVMHCTLGDWTSLVEWVKGDDAAQDLGDAEWEDINVRRDRCEHLFDVLDAWAHRYSVGELVEGAQLRRIPYAPVVAPESLPQQPQLSARRFFVPLADPDTGATVAFPGAPYVFSRTPWALARRPPRLDEHRGEGWMERTSPPVHAPAPYSANGTARVLDGVRILDFTWVVAGPVATRILADHGAQVLKVERRDALDFGSRRGGLTGNLNRGKQSLVINMNLAAGVALAKRLAAAADVVIDNFSARVMYNWGLNYDALRELRADIIAVNMSGFGHTGPQRDYVSYGPTLQALSGFTQLMRHTARPPAGWGFSYSDMAGGYHAALAVLLALWHRQQTGEGQCVDLSQFESLAALLGPGLLDIIANDAQLQPVANRSQERPAAPHGVYRCADRPESGIRGDRWCAIAVFTDDEWARLSAVAGRPAWAEDAQFASHAGRLAHQAALDQYIESWTRTQTAEAVMHRLQAVGVAAGVVANARDLCRDDAHLHARGYWVRVATPEGDAVELDGVPIKLSQTPGRVTAPGPLLGEQTDTVLHNVLGLSADEVGALRAQGVIA